MKAISNSQANSTVSMTMKSHDRIYAATNPFQMRFHLILDSLSNQNMLILQITGNIFYQLLIKKAAADQAESQAKRDKEEELEVEFMFHRLSTIPIRKHQCHHKKIFKRKYYF